MIGVTASVDAKAAAYIDNALRQMSADFSKAAKTAPKVMALALCDSLRNKTKKAPKRARRNEYELRVSTNPPPYITYRRGERLPIALHRWTLTRKLGTPDQYSHDYYAYAHLKHGKGGKIVKDLAAERAEIRKFHLGIARAGLAKMSWNWIKSEIRGGGVDAISFRRKGERRDPRQSVNGEYRKEQNGATARVCNKLDYILDALKDMALTQATRDAVARTAFNTARRSNYSIDQAKEYARWLANQSTAA